MNVMHSRVQISVQSMTFRVGGLFEGMRKMYMGI